MASTGFFPNLLQLKRVRFLDYLTVCGVGLTEYKKEVNRDMEAFMEKGGNVIVIRRDKGKRTIPGPITHIEVFPQYIQAVLDTTSFDSVVKFLEGA